MHDGNNTFTQILNVLPHLNLHDVRADSAYRFAGNRISPDTNSTGLTSNLANLNVILQLPSSPCNLNRGINEHVSGAHRASDPH